MLCSLPNRCVHHHRPPAWVGFCLPNVPLTVCLFLTKRRPVIFKLAPTACDHHFLADTMITCSSGVEHEMISPPLFTKALPCTCRLGLCKLRKWLVAASSVFFLSVGDVYFHCRANYHPHPAFLLEQRAMKMHLSRLLVWSKRVINKEWLVFSYPPSSEIIDYPIFWFCFLAK